MILGVIEVGGVTKKTNSYICIFTINFSLYLPDTFHGGQRFASHNGVRGDFLHGVVTSQKINGRSSAKNKRTGSGRTPSVEGDTIVHKDREWVRDPGIGSFRREHYIK